MKTNTKALLIAGSAVAATLAIGGEAKADTTLVNEYVNGYRNVRSNLSVSSIKTIRETYYKNTQGIKMETNFPNARGSVSIQNGQLSGGMSVRTDGPDPFLAAVYTNDITRGSSVETVNTLYTETQFGVDRIYRHSISGIN